MLDHLVSQTRDREGGGARVKRKCGETGTERERERETINEKNEMQSKASLTGNRLYSTFCGLKSFLCQLAS